MVLLSYVFRQECLDGNLEKVKKYYNENEQKEFMGDAPDFFKKICSNGQIDVAEWIYDKIELSYRDIVDAFRKAYKYDKYDIMYWLINIRAIDHSVVAFFITQLVLFGLIDHIENFQKNLITDRQHTLLWGFLVACNVNRIDIAKYLYSLNIDIDSLGWFIEYSPDENQDDDFMNLVYGDINIYMIHNDMNQSACVSIRDRALLYASNNENVELFEWLSTIAYV